MRENKDIDRAIPLSPNGPKVSISFLFHCRWTSVAPPSSVSGSCLSTDGSGCTSMLVSKYLEPEIFSFWSSMTLFGFKGLKFRQQRIEKMKTKVKKNNETEEEEEEKEACKVCCECSNFFILENRFYGCSVGESL